MKRDKSLSLPEAAPRQPLAPELCEHIGFMLGKARQELVERIERLTAPHSVKHLGTLLVLTRRGALRQTELAGTLRLDRTTMMNIVDELEAAGFVKRGADPDDRRAYAVKATARGQQWVEKLRPTAEQIEKSFLEALTAAEQETLRQLLLRLVTHPGDSQ